MWNLFLNAQWDELYAFFASGNPPLAVQLLCLNTICFILWVVRRMHGHAHMRAGVAICLQSLLLAGNAFILFQRDILHWL